MGFCQSLGLGLLLVAMYANCLLGLWGADVFELLNFLIIVFEKKFKISEKRVLACSRARGAHAHRAQSTQVIPLDSPCPK